MKTLARFVTYASRTPYLFASSVVLILALYSTCVSAQSGAGSIQGTVTDSTGAVIPGAVIRVVNQSTAVANQTKSSNVGFYQVPGLFTGAYSVTITAPGFKTYKTKIQLLVAQSAVINASLTAGDVTQQVEVNANTVQLTDTEDGTIASTLENARINQLPMNGRNIATLAGMVTPGLEGNGTRANGLFGEALEYVADGVPLSNRQFGGDAQNPDPDAVQELRIETSNTSAQYTEPGTVIITTKSGTNSLHGSLFETARNNAIGIAKNRNNPSNFSAPKYIRNEWGASAGGPIILPHLYHGKDKSFWFFAYERYSLASSSNELVTVPTMAMRGGDFSGLINGEGILQQLYDSATTAYSANCNGSGTANQYCRAPFANNQIPMSRLAPLTKILYDITPPPDNANNPMIASNLSTPAINNTIVPTITFRLDHNFNERNKAYLRYTSNISTQLALRNNPNSPVSIAADGLPAGATGLAYNPTATFAPAIGFTHVFSPSFFAETIISQQWYGQHNYAGGAPFTNYEKELGLPNNFGELGFPQIASGAFTTYAGTQFVYGLAQIISNLDENMTKIIGRHQMQFGGRYRHERFTYMGQKYDFVRFSNQATSIYNPASGKNYSGTPNAGNINGDLFLGAASSYEVEIGAPVTHFHDMEFDGYFQDDFHVNRNFTVDLGLRYEDHPGAWSKYGVVQSFDFKNKAIVMTNPISYYITKGYTTQAMVTNLQNIGVVFETPQQAGFPSSMIKNYPLALSPRLGFAYQPFNGKYGTVIRGAYGRYIYPMPVRNFEINPPGVDPPYNAAYTQDYTAANQSPDGLPNYLLRAPQSVVAGLNSANVVDTNSISAILPGLPIWTFNPDFPPDFVTETNLTIEQPLKGNSVLRVSWVYSHGTNLDQYYYVNSHPSAYVYEMIHGQIPPTGGASVIGTPQQNTYAATATGPYDQSTYGGGMTWDEKGGWSNDNALQATFQRLYHNGVAYQINYTWSRPFRIGGNYFRDGNIYPYANYISSAGTVSTMTSPYGTVISPILPPAQPSNIAPYAMTHALNRWQNYKLDTGIPLQHITFNGIVDLPVGRGKRLLGNANRFLNELVGGFQLAGDGSVVTQEFGVASGNWGPTNPLHVYKHHAPITDCRSGTCYKAYEWFNGYIPPTAAAGFSGGCTLAAKTVQGLPSNWAPYQSPIDTDCNPTDPAYKYYGGNTVAITLPGGSPTPMGYSPGPTGTNPYSRTFLPGPWNYAVDLSLFKVFPITERTNLRFNMDAFNALNVQGYNNPSGGDGTEAYQPNGVSSSHNTPRQIQLTLRLTF